MRVTAVIHMHRMPFRGWCIVVGPAGVMRSVQRGKGIPTLTGMAIVGIRNERLQRRRANTDQRDPGKYVSCRVKKRAPHPRPCIWSDSTPVGRRARCVCNDVIPRCLRKSLVAKWKMKRAKIRTTAMIPSTFIQRGISLMGISPGIIEISL